MSDSILITSSTGAIGSRLLLLLLANLPSTTTLICPTSNPSRLATLAAKHPNLLAVQGQISDANFLEHLCRSHTITKVFLNIGGDSELFTCLNALDAFARSKTVQHVVHVSAHGDFTTPAGAQKVFQSSLAAHYLLKHTIENVLLHGGLPYTWTVLGPTAFFDNDVRFGKTAETGFLALPYGTTGVSRVSCEDIALAGFKALVNEGGWLSGRKIPLGSLRTYSGVETAEIWSRALGGRAVEWRRDDEEGLRALEADFEPVLGKSWGRDLALMYRGYLRSGWALTEADYAFEREVLDKEAEDYETWVHEVVRHE